MPEAIALELPADGRATSADAMGMREMQRLAYAKRDAKYLLVKSPPASGKSRALMFVGLDKLRRQGLRKVIVAVPEQAIGASFASRDLRSGGFPWDWHVEPEWNLCGASVAKVSAVAAFMASSAEAMVCTHATLRFAHATLGSEAFDGCLVAIDEFHHSSADEGNRLGGVCRDLMARGMAHIVAMTGTFFRGDGDPVLRPEDEDRFEKVTYTFYQQLSGYAHLKSLGIGFRFYQGSYLDSIGDVLDGRKTIVHIPSVNASESRGDKYVEADAVLATLGTYVGEDGTTGFLEYRTPQGDSFKVADLVNDDAKRERVLRSLREMSDPDHVNTIVALNMAKEGFDWPACEHALTVGYRTSMVEIIQILGRVTRDYPGKEHAQFTLMVARPDVSDVGLDEAVNNEFLVIACLLLMEQVMAPSFSFKARPKDAPTGTPGQGDLFAASVARTEGRPATAGGDGGRTVIEIAGFREPSTPRSRQVVDECLDDLKSDILRDRDAARVIMGLSPLDPDHVNREVIPRAIRRRHPDLDANEVEEVRQYLLADTLIRAAAVRTGKPERGGKPETVSLSGKVFNVDALDIDLIDQSGMFGESYQVVSRTLDVGTFTAIHGALLNAMAPMTDDELLRWENAYLEHVRLTGSSPRLTSDDSDERSMAKAHMEMNRRRREYRAAA